MHIFYWIVQIKFISELCKMISWITIDLLCNTELLNCVVKLLRYFYRGKNLLLKILKMGIYFQFWYSVTNTIMKSANSFPFDSCQYINMYFCHHVIISLCHYTIILMSIFHYTFILICHYVIMSWCHYAMFQYVTISLSYFVPIHLHNFITQACKLWNSFNSLCISFYKISTLLCLCFIQQL